MDRGAWWATIHGVAKSQTGLKQLSTHALIAYIWNLKKKNDRNELIYKTELQCGKQTYGYQIGKGGRINRLGFTHTHHYM